MIDSAPPHFSSPNFRATRRVTPAHILARLIAALGGGWLFVWGFIALGIMTLLSVGMPFRDARSLVHLLAFLLFLTVACWAFAAPRLTHVYVVLFGGGAVMTATAWWMARASVS